LLQKQPTHSSSATPPASLSAFKHNPLDGFCTDEIVYGASPANNCRNQAITGIAMTENPVGYDLDFAKEGRYAYHFLIGHNAFEVILQFGQFYEGYSHPVMHTRIVTGPAYAQGLLQLLSQALDEYESTFGPISKGERRD
jgi:hypothetical protein